VLDVSRRITVLRRGAVEFRCDTQDADPVALTRAIVGDDPAATPATTASAPDAGDAVRDSEAGEVRLSVRGLSLQEGRTPLRDITFDLRAGEILAVAGVDGNGQDELVEGLAGLAAAATGSVRLEGRDVTNCSVRERWDLGLAVLPGDRSRNGLWPDASVWENLALREFGAAWARGFAGTVDPARHRARAEELVARHDIRTPGINVPVRSLSGGNGQKLLFARELAGEPRVLVVQNPTRGLDVGAARALHAALRARRDAGCSVLLISTELEEVLEIGDRHAALNGGRLREGRGDAASLGALMLREDAA
ncbi:MAG: ATP-binding cassette domain-containing protein, partial [Gemmatimonadetes bacterium]|nr:ATP-binding cassette domain-containing protein [Gemmatimonadota bacterium]